MVRQCLPDLDEDDAVDKVQHLQHAAYRGPLDLQGREVEVLLPFVDFVHFLLEGDCILCQTFKVVGALSRLLMLLSKL